MKTTRATVLLLLGVALAAPAASQFIQYIPPGGVEQLEGSTIREELEAAIKSSKWRFGKLFLDPWFSLKDLGYDDNIGNRPETSPQLSDYTATLGLGLQAYVPAGARTTLALHALPEYVWWEELAERRRVNGRYGVGLFTGGGRIDLALSATRVEETRFFSRQFEDRVNATDERGSLSLDFALGHGFVLNSTATLLRLEYDGQDENSPNVGRADREERVGRLGLRRRLQGGFSIGVGFEAAEVDFIESDNPRTNTSDAPFVEVALERDTLSGAVFVAARDLEFEGGVVEPYSSSSGRFWVGWRPVLPAEIQFFGNRNLVYSFQDDWPYLEDSSAGVGLKWQFGPRFSARVFTEEGTNDYTAFDPQAATRRDDFVGVGGRLEIKLGKVKAVIDGARTRYESTIPAFDRSIKTIAIGVTLGSSSDGPWT